jgi:dTDP-D-glucose 4,6-dehydratase
LLRELTNRAIPVEFEDWRPGDQPCYVSNIEKARSRLGWSPLVDMETGVRRLVDWVRANPDLFALAAMPPLSAPTAARAGRREAYAWGTN